MSMTGIAVAAEHRVPVTVVETCPPRRAVIKRNVIIGLEITVTGRAVSLVIRIRPLAKGSNIRYPGGKRHQGDDTDTKN